MSALNWSLYGRVYFDSAPIIYHLEAHPLYSPPLEELFDAIDAGSITGVVSGVTLAECLHYPIRQNDRELEQDYLTLMTDYDGVEFIDIDAWVSDLAVRLRVKHALDLLDAFQLAAAIIGRADVFVTNDLVFQRVTEIPVIILSKVVSAPQPAPTSDDTPRKPKSDLQTE